MSKINIKKVFISTNEHPLYIQFWPVVATMWRKLGKDPILALVTNKPEEEWEWMKEFGEVVQFPVRVDIPAGNWAKLARWRIYYKYPEDIGMVSDIDMLPISEEYFSSYPDEWDESKLLIKGYDAYGGGRDRKFPGCYMIARGDIWKEIINPNNLSQDEWVESLIGTQKYDHKEDPSKAHSIFSEESLMRVAVYRWNPERNRIVPESRPYGWPPIKTRICRSQWVIDKNRLNKKMYIDCHSLRPLDKNINALMPIFNYFEINKDLALYGVEMGHKMCANL
jgi:hypothetical protein